MSSNTKKDNREMCKYGSECYQKNPFHYSKFRHPKREAKAPTKNAKKAKLDTRAPATSKQSPSKSKTKKAQQTKAAANKETKDHEVSESSSEFERESDFSSSEDEFAPVYRATEKTIVVKELQGDDREKLKQLYVVPFPDDFFAFYDYCRSLSPKSPKTALKEIQLELVGPFDFLSGDIRSCTPTDILRHYRFFFDPPEFFTVAKSTETEYHLGYFFDEPDKPPVFVGSNNPAINCAIRIIAPNLFGAVNVYIDNCLKECTPFKKPKIQKVKNSLQKWAKEHDIILDVTSSDLNRRMSKVNALTFHSAGIVVPYDPKTDVGYRPLAESNKMLRERFRKIKESFSIVERDINWNKIEHVITYANIAADECDFGSPLELGINMFTVGHPYFHRTIIRLLTTAYQLLNRHHFIKVITAHLKFRMKGSNLNFAANNDEDE